MAFAGRRVIGLWAGPSIHPSQELIVAYGAVYVFTGFQTTLAFLFNGLGTIRFQLFLAIPVVLTSIALKIICVPVFGLVAVPFVTLAIGMLLTMPVQLLYLRHLLRSLEPGSRTKLPASEEMRISG